MAQLAEQRDAQGWLMRAVVPCATFVDVAKVFLVNVAALSIERELYAIFAAVRLAVADYMLA
jgi:hypothetical protein